MALILIVDDNPDILKNLRFTLEMQNYDVLTAENVQQALGLMEEKNQIPDLIISDILMPETNGYEFFEKISANPKWSTIPFLFLTAKSSAEDIRYGKSLGVDDYITKPFNNKDLISAIKGKLLRKQMATSVQKKFEELMDTPSIGEEKSVKDLTLLTVFWDDDLGPKLRDYFPREERAPFDIKEVAAKLFNGIVLIYGQKNIQSAEGILIKLERIGKWGYIYFDAYPDETTRSGQKKYMIGVIASKITYFESLRIKDIIRDVSAEIKSQKSLNVKTHWESIRKVL